MGRISSLGNLPRNVAAAMLAAASDTPGLPAGEAIAYDIGGRPMIVRQAEPDSGQMRTFVQDEDGSIRAFGEKTVASLVKATEDEVDTWLNKLSDRSLRGLVHEVGQRLLLYSSMYQIGQSELQKLSKRAHMMYFGLAEDSTEKELDNAYRQLAKKMHPDKNGGTEDAKKRFQHMKERYETLKKLGRESGDNEKGAEEEESEEDEERPDDEGAKSDEHIEYNPADRNSLDETVWKMIKQYKSMQRGLSTIQQELARKRHEVN